MVMLENNKIMYKFFSFYECLPCCAPFVYSVLLIFSLQQFCFLFDELCAPFSFCAILLFYYSMLLFYYSAREKDPAEKNFYSP